MIRVPGFIDLQVNGFLGVEFSSPNLTEAETVRVSRALLDKGCAGFLATIITSSEETYKRNLPILVKAMRHPELQGGILGIHAEGPFLSARPGAVGAHNPTWVKSPDIDFFKKMVEWSDGTLKLLTIAAENEGSEKLTKYAVSQGVTVSLGHQLALAEDMKKCVDAGATLLTHLGNGMPNEVNRHNNSLMSGLAEDGLTAMIITDGHHLPPTVIKTVLKAKGIDKTLIVSDASPIAGMPPGKYRVLGNETVLEENGYLHNPTKNCLVGSSATIFECVNYLASLNIVTPEELIKLAFTNPLQAIGMSSSAIKTGAAYTWNGSKFIKA